jgi:hypothetical protein
MTPDLFAAMMNYARSMERFTPLIVGRTSSKLVLHSDEQERGAGQASPLALKNAVGPLPAAPGQAFDYISAPAPHNQRLSKPDPTEECCSLAPRRSAGDQSGGGAVTLSEQPVTYGLPAGRGCPLDQRALFPRRAYREKQLCAARSVHHGREIVPTC